jgi:hypothetical protein
LVGDYTTTPAIFLPVLFLVVALASYKFGQLGASQVPYAYFLLGLTTLTIATDGVTDPTHAWQIGLDRIGGDFGRNHELASGNKGHLQGCRIPAIESGLTCSPNLSDPVSYLVNQRFVFILIVKVPVH